MKTSRSSLSSDFPRKMKVKIVQQELKEDGVLTTYSNGHVEMLPYLIDENGEEYVEMLPNDIEQH